MPGAGRLACAVLAAAVVVNLVADGIPVGPVNLYEVIAGAAMVLAWVALARAAPPHPWAWRWLLGGFSLWVLGDMLWAAERVLLGPDAFPAWSDALYLAGYACLGAGALQLVRTREAARDRTAVLDAVIVAVGVAVPTWVFVMAPAAADSSLGMSGRLVASAYPVLDLFLVAVLFRLLATPGARTGAFRRLAWALVVTLAADVAWNVGAVVVGASFVSRWTDAAWLSAYVLVAAATCHPSFSSVTEPPPRQTSSPTSWRLAALAFASALPALTLLADGWSGDVAWQAASLGSAALSLLVLSRMAGLLGQVQVQAVQLSALARMDGLTGIPNRRTWDHELSRACAVARDTGEPLAVALLDLDRFKRFNDRHGHQAGDRLLVGCATAWTEGLAPHGGLLARYGGEEFAVLLPGLGSDAACAVLEALRRATPGGQSFSAGVAVWDPAAEPSAAVAAADSAMYEAKRLGRDRVVAAAGVPSRDALPTWAAAAQVLLEPVLSAVDGTLVGHEASARFPHDPDACQVLARATEEGYGDLLEAHVLQRALAVPGRPAGSALFVHLGAAALRSPRFWATVPDDLADVVVHLEGDRSWAPVVTGAAVPEAALDLLRARGAELAVDDLGGGRGGLGRLLRVRPEVVKISATLVAGCGDDPVRLELVGLVVRLAGTAGARVCAEGVGSAADLQALRACGVQLVQGPHLGPPAAGWTAVPAGGRSAPAPV